jgi:transcriptional regulator with XRE-family HTH domain
VERDGSLDEHRPHRLTTDRHDKGRAGAAGGSDSAAELGPRLRAIRLRQAIGLRELARRLDLSPSSISQIETGKIRPSVSTLYALASEFGVTVDEVLFDEPRTLSGATPKSAPDAPSLTEPKLTVQRADARPAINLSSGVKWERMGLWADEDVEFLEAIYEPGGASSPDDSFVRHSGHEFGVILSGTLRVIVGFDEFVLAPGDSITFPSTTPHRLINDGPQTVRAVWVVRGRRGAESDHELAADMADHALNPGHGRASGRSGS